MAHHLTITRRDIEAAERMGRSAMRHKEKVENVMGAVTQTAEISVAAFGMGVLQGRFGPISLGPIPVDLLAFALLSLGGYMGLGGKYNEHMHNFADGLGASYLHTLGAGFGVSWGQKAGKSPFATSGAHIAGAIGSGSAPLTEAELAAMAHAVR